MKTTISQPDDSAGSPRTGRSSLERPCLQRLRATGINWSLRILVGGAFIVAGSLKIANPEQFAVAVGNYRILPHGLINLVAIILPWVEVVAGLFLLAGVWMRAALMVIISMTLVFAAAILSALARGLNIECGCFGTIGGKHIGLVNLAIDTTLFCLAVFLAWRVGNCPDQSKFQGGRCADLRNTTRGFTV